MQYNMHVQQKGSLEWEKEEGQDNALTVMKSDTIFRVSGRQAKLDISEMLTESKSRERQVFQVKDSYVASENTWKIPWVK